MNTKSPYRISVFQALLILFFVFLCVYFVARVIFLSFAGYEPIEKIMASLFLLAEIFIMLQAIGYFRNVYALHHRSNVPLVVPPLDKFPPVAILVPARHEPKAVLKATFTSLVNLNYPDKNIYFLDDSSDEQYRTEAEELTKEFGLKLFRREERHGAKAGVINDCVKTLEEKYIAIFDADQCPISGFLLNTVPFLEANSRLAFVQTPQFYSNLGSNRVSYATNMQQAVFYEYICEGKSNSRSMICCGTNVVLRREALLSVGGLDETTVTEDFATSVKLHSLGWESLYYNHVYTFGMGPEDLASYFKQQNRWALGNVSVLKTLFKEFFKNPRALRPSQWFEYFITGSYYLIGWAYALLILCPITYLFFNIPSFFMNPVVYLCTFFPYMALSIAIYASCMKQRQYSIRQIFYGYLLSFITLPVYMAASLNGLRGVQGKFQVTAKGKAQRISYIALWPQLLLWAINLIALTWGLNRLVYEQEPSIFLNVFWAGYHFILLSSIFHFNENENNPWSNVKKLYSKASFECKVLGNDPLVESAMKAAKRDCFTVMMSKPLLPGQMVMGKISCLGFATVVFDGKVLDAIPLRWQKKHKILIQVLSAPAQGRENLDKVLRP